MNAASDDRTNTLVVTAPADAMIVITGILKEIDSNPSAGAPLFIYHLRNGVATDMQQTLNSLFGGGTSSGTSTRRQPHRRPVAAILGARQQQRLRQQWQQPKRQPGTRRQQQQWIWGSAHKHQQFQPHFVRLQWHEQQRHGQPQSPRRQRVDWAGRLCGRCRYQLPARQHRQPLSGAGQKIIEELDRPVPQVLIKVLVAEVTHERTNDLGIDFSVLDTRASGKGLNWARSSATPPPLPMAGWSSA